MDWKNELKNLDGWYFGGKGSGIEDQLANLVAEGIKSATCSWYEVYQMEESQIPKVGDRSYILNSEDEPVCIIEVIDVEVKPFLEVDEEFAYLEGEGDRSYAYWKTAHEKFFTNYGKEIGLQWDSKTQSVVCEKFMVLHAFY